MNWIYVKELYEWVNVINVDDLELALDVNKKKYNIFF